MIRIFVNWQMWECYKSGMYRQEPNHELYLKKALEFMSNTKAFSKAMNSVVNEWGYTMMHHLTNSSINRIAFVGQCACSYAINCPESIVREAWKMLTEKQRNDADSEAKKAVQKYMSKK